MKIIRRILAIALSFSMLMTFTACVVKPAAKEKILRYGISNPWDSLMPYNSASGSNYARLIYDKIYDRLAYVHADGTLSPRGAKSWESTDDGYGILFHLDTKAAFHDGTPVTATHWAETLRLVTDKACPTLGRSQLAVLAGTDENGVCVDTLGVEAVDDATLKLTLKEKTTPEDFLIDKNREIYVLPTYLFEGAAVKDLMKMEIWNNPIGSGPCIFEGEISGSELDLKANKNYQLGAPGFDRLTITVMDKANLLPSLIAGDLDYYAVGGSLSADDAELAKKAGFTVEQGTVPNIFYELMINNTNLPNQAVRNAISLALDRQLLCQQATHGLGTVTGTSVLPGTDYFAYYPTSVLQRNLEAAQTIIATEGCKPLTLATTSARAGLAALMQQNLVDAGIAVTIETVDSATLFSGMTDGKYDLAIASHTPSPLPLWFVESRLTAGNNIFHLYPQELQEVQGYLSAVKNEETQQEKVARAKELQDFLAAKTYFIPLWFSVGLHVQSKTVTGIDFASAASSNENVWDWEKI
ncbi:MAG: ABC transporter substrate-binding protein [Oscillospiraceae bacterium]